MREFRQSRIGLILNRRIEFRLISIPERYGRVQNLARPPALHR